LLYENVEVIIDFVECAIAFCFINSNIVLMSSKMTIQLWIFFRNRNLHV